MWKFGILRETCEFIGFCVFGLLVAYILIEVIFKKRVFKNIAGDAAVVTGAGHGLGRAIALELASKGCHVAVVDINLKGAEETVEMIKSRYQVKCKAYEIDVTSSEQVLDLNRKIKTDIGIATILINNAGIILLSNYVQQSLTEIQRMINVNLMAHFVTNSIFIENMKSQRKGHIVAICSIAGIIPFLYHTAYCATKSGVRGLMRVLRLELNMYNYDYIRTTTVFPSFLNTKSEVLDFLNSAGLPKLFPIVTGESAARSIVSAMQRNEVELVLPRPFAAWIYLLGILPASWQDVFLSIGTRLNLSNHKEARDNHKQSIESEN